MAKLVKHIGLQGGQATTTSTSYATSSNIFPFTWDADAYDGTLTIYFEAMISIGSGGTGYATLVDSANNVVTGGEINTTSTVLTRVRSSSVSLTDGETYNWRIKSSNASYTCTVNGAKLVVVQEGTLTKTRTVITMQTAAGSTTGTNYSNLATAGLYKHEADYWGGTLTCYAEVYHKTNTGNTGYSQLYTGSQVCELTTVNTSSELVRSGSISLGDGTTYWWRHKTTGGTSNYYGTRIIIDQTVSVAPTALYHQGQGSFSSTSTSGAAQLRKAYWDADEWSGFTLTHYLGGQMWGNTGTGNTHTIEIQDASNNVLGSIVTTTVTVAGTYLLGDSFTIAGDNLEVDFWVKTSNATYATNARCMYWITVASEVSTGGQPFALRQLFKHAAGGQWRPARI